MKRGSPDRRTLTEIIIRKAQLKASAYLILDTHQHRL
jgi:hypothetical protein